MIDPARRESQHPAACTGKWEDESAPEPVEVAAAVAPRHEETRRMQGAGRASCMPGSLLEPMSPIVRKAYAEAVEDVGREFPGLEIPVCRVYLRQCLERAGIELGGPFQGICTLVPGLRTREQER